MTKSAVIRMIFALVLFWPSLVPAATPTPSQGAALPGSLQHLGHKLGLTVVKSFPTDAPGVTGFVVKDSGGHFGVIYTYKDFVISGALLNADGTNLTDKYADQYIPKPDYAAVVKALAGSPGLVSEGKAGAPEVYVFADPNCYYCRKLWELTRKWVAEGKVRIHWVLVGFLKASSEGRAAAILAAKDGAKALTEDEDLFNLKHEEGGVSELKPIPPKYKRILAKHLAYMQELRFQGTPGVVYKGTDGHWEGIPGVPPMDKFAKALGIAD